MNHHVPTGTVLKITFSRDKGSEGHTLPYDDYQGRRELDHRAAVEAARDVTVSRLSPKQATWWYYQRNIRLRSLQ
jgi:hypothetical protein